MIFDLIIVVWMWIVIEWTKLFKVVVTDGLPVRNIFIGGLFFGIKSTKMNDVMNVGVQSTRNDFRFSRGRFRLIEMKYEIVVTFEFAIVC